MKPLPKGLFHGALGALTVESDYEGKVIELVEKDQEMKLPAGWKQWSDIAFDNMIFLVRLKKKGGRWWLRSCEGFDYSIEEWKRILREAMQIIDQIRDMESLRTRDVLADEIDEDPKVVSGFRMSHLCFDDLQPGDVIEVV